MVLIAKQFNGPRTSGNGGYVSGLLAQAYLAQGHRGPVSSRLTMPPPLATPLSWEHSEGVTRLLTHGGAVVGTAESGTFRRPAPRPVTTAEVEAGLAAYPGFTQHPFAGCFTCGSDREAGDGLCIFTGPIGDDLTAGPWHVHPSFADHDGRIPLPIIWAALDCPGGWSADFNRQPMVLGTMTAEVTRAPEPGEDLRAVGELASHEGRKFFTSTALHTAEGELIGRSEQIWIEIDIADFGG